MKKLFFLFLSFVAFSSVVLGQNDDVAVPNDDESVAEFPSFLTPDFKYIEKVISDPTSPYYYPVLMKRFNAADTSMTINDLHCLYYGAALQDDYNPYGRDENEIVNKALDLLNKEAPSKKELKKALKYLDKAIDMAPMNLDLYNYRHYVNYMLYGQDSRQERADVFHFIGLLSAIAYSGDGQDMATAYYVINPSHEYTLLRYWELHSLGQSLLQQDGQSYDLLELAENDKDVDELYFNITICFSYLSKLFKNIGGDEDGDVEEEVETEE